MSEQRIKNNIASNISFYRKQSGFTQASLAQALGVKATTVSTWERGASLPDADVLFAMCSLFGISIQTLYGESPVADPAGLNDFERQLIAAYRNASESRKEAVRTLLDMKEEKK